MFNALTGIREQFLKRYKHYSIGLLLLLAACGGAAQPTLTPTPSMTPSPVPTSSPTAIPSPPTPTPIPSATPVVVTLEPLLGQSVEPPLDIDLPGGWDVVLHDTFIFSDVDTLRGLPITVYSGPVAGGTGTLILLWGFPNVVEFNPISGQGDLDLWSDGLRLLRLAVLDLTCDVTTDVRRNYEVGGLPAVGTEYNASNCPDLPDSRGWFAGLQESGLNFVFYTFTEPTDAIDGARGQLQAILDSVRFRVPVPESEPGE